MGSLPDSAQPSATHHHIVALEAQFTPPILPFNLPPPFTYTLVQYQRTAPEEVAERIKDATIILVTILPLDAHLLSEEVCPNLKLIGVIAAGYDGIDLKTCRRRGIGVVNEPEANMHTVTEHAIGMYFALRRKFIELHLAMKANELSKKPTLMKTLEGPDRKMPLTASEETIGMIGHGTIGKRIADMARLLGMKVLIAERKGAKECRGGKTPFEEVLKQSTVIVLVLPRSPESLNLISTEEFRLMKPQALLINVSRGGIMDEKACLAALRENQIAGAATDVFIKEPATRENNVLVREDTSDLNLLLTPHTAWISDLTLRNQQTTLKENVEAWCAGNPINVVI